MMGVQDFSRGHVVGLDAEAAVFDQALQGAEFGFGFQQSQAGPHHFAPVGGDFERMVADRRWPAVDLYQVGGTEPGRRAAAGRRVASAK